MEYSMEWREVLVLAILYAALHYLTRLILPTARASASASPLPLPPGPWGYPVVGALPLLGRAPHRSLAALARLHGPIIHLTLGSRGVVVVSTPEAARLLLKDHGGSFLDRPVDDAGPRLMAYGAQDLAFAPYGPKWRRLRRECSLGLLGPQALADWYDTRREEVGYMVQAVLNRRDEEVDVPEILFRAMVNVIGQAVVGRRVVEDEAGARELKEMVVEMITMAGLVNIGDFVPAVAWMDLQGLGRRMRRLMAKLDRVWSRLLSEHEAARQQGQGSSSFRPDLVDRLMACRGEDDVTDVSIKALLNDLFTAGTDTSSSTIEWALAEMLVNPAILRRAQAEMDAVVGRDRLLQESDIPQLPYLHAICKETFRKHPSTPLSLPRISTQPCDDVQGYHIPKGTRLIVNIWAIGRDPAVWPHPTRFDPDRFTTEQGTKMEPMGNHFELIPFGAGRRICAGARMGVTMVHHMLGALVHAFDWEIPQGQGAAGMDMDEDFGLALQKKVPVRAMARPRLTAGAYQHHQC